MQGDDLAVEVGGRDLVIVDQIERAHARARQRLDHIAADPADAENRDACAVQLFHRFCAEQRFGARKLPVHSMPSRMSTAFATQLSQEQSILPVVTPLSSRQIVAPQRSRKSL